MAIGTSATQILTCTRMAISHSYWHVVVKNGNFILLLTSSGLEWQFHIATDIWWLRNWQISADILLQMHVGSYIKACIWHIAADSCSEEQVGNFILISDIIRVVNSQLALYSHVRCKPPWHPWNTPETSPHDQISHPYWHICQVVVKNSIPQYWISHCYWHLVVKYVNW